MSKLANGLIVYTGFIWLAMLKTIDVNLATKRVLDAGCNRGDIG